MSSTEVFGVPEKMIVFLHGVGGSPFTWDAQTGALPPGTQASAPWLRGLRPGASGQAQRFDLGDAAAEVATALQFDGPATLVGHALGARVALRAAVDHPDLVERLVLVAPPPVPGRFAGRIQRSVLRRAPANRLPGAGMTRQRWLEVVDALTHPEDPDVLRRVEVPTLLVAGERDRLGSAEVSRLVHLLPQARAEVVPGAGPHVMSDAPQAFNELLRDVVAT